jgi:cytochrome c oxidase cbb3-type subunit I
VRLIGGATFFCGMLVMAYNVYMTSRKGVGVREPSPVAASAA